MTSDPDSKDTNEYTVRYDYDELVERMPQVPPHVFIDVVSGVEADKYVYTSFLLAGADPRLVTLASGRRVLSLGITVEPMLQGALLGRTLGQAKEEAKKSAFLLKRFSGRCLRLAQAGERVDFSVHARWIRESWGLTAVMATGSFGPIMELPKVAWFQTAREGEDRLWGKPQMLPMESDPLYQRPPLLDFMAIQNKLGLQDPEAVHLDAVLEIQPGQEIVTMRRVASGLSQMRAHYPGMAVMAGAYLVEAAWQSLCILFDRPLCEPCPGHPLELSMNWNQPSIPGETLIITSKMSDADTALIEFTSARGDVAEIQMAGIDAILRSGD